MLRYFQLKDYLRRLYNSNHTTKEILRHRIGGSTKDGVMWHPIGNEVSKKFDRRFTSFIVNTCNPRG